MQLTRHCPTCVGLTKIYVSTLVFLSKSNEPFHFPAFPTSSQSESLAAWTGHLKKNALLATSLLRVGVNETSCYYQYLGPLTLLFVLKYFFHRDRAVHYLGNHRSFSSISDISSSKNKVLRIKSFRSHPCCKTTKLTPKIYFSL